MAEYLATSYATQRTKLICAAKFPKKVEVASYTQIRNPLRAALTKPLFDRDGLDFLAAKMDAKAGTEIGYSRDEALRCAKAIRAFQDTFSPKPFARYTLAASARALTKPVAGVRINVSLDAAIIDPEGAVAIVLRVCRAGALKTTAASYLVDRRPGPTPQRAAYLQPAPPRR